MNLQTAGDGGGEGSLLDDYFHIIFAQLIIEVAGDSDGDSGGDSGGYPVREFNCHMALEPRVRSQDQRGVST